MTCDIELDAKLNEMLSVVQQDVLEYSKQQEESAKEDLQVSHSVLTRRMDDLEILMKQEMETLENLTSDHVVFQEESKELIESLIEKLSVLFQSANIKYRSSMEHYENDIQVVIEKAHHQMK